MSNHVSKSPRSNLTTSTDLGSEFNHSHCQLSFLIPSQNCSISICDNCTSPLNHTPQRKALFSAQKQPIRKWKATIHLHLLISRLGKPRSLSISMYAMYSRHQLKQGGCSRLKLFKLFMKMLQSLSHASPGSYTLLYRSLDTGMIIGTLPSEPKESSEDSLRGAASIKDLTR